jgi:hypothetical protein
MLIRTAHIAQSAESYDRNLKQKTRRGFPRRVFISIIVLRRNPSLADLAATYSSKP